MTTPTLRLGDLELLSICAGHFHLDAGTMFGLVPRPLWERQVSADEQNRLPLSCNCLLIRNGRELTLIDAGIGDRFTDKERQIYAIDPSATLLDSLVEAGVRPEEVTRVIFTHLHFDHFCGALTGEEGAWQPTFPNAVHCVQEGEWGDALSGRSIMRTTYRTAEFRFLKEQVALQLLRGDTQFSPYLSSFVTGGHTEHHQGVLIRTPEGNLVYPADVMPTRFHLRPYWGTAYDMFPYQTFICKEELLPRICREGWIVAWNHDPQSVWNRLRFDGKSYQPVEIDS